MKIATIIPIYNSQLTDNIALSVKHNIEMLNTNSDIIFIYPSRLDITYYKANFNAEYFSFDDNYFKSSKTYNLLLLQKEFYYTFYEYDFILICHLDTYVFKNNLNYWVDQNYDYIGAPWLDQDWLPNHCGVGNGGFCLRKISFYINALTNMQIQNAIKPYIGALNEDFLLSTFLQQMGIQINLPSVEIAAHFAWETCIDKCKKICENKLPMAIHSFYL